jgi:hypothetical protein
MGSLLHPTGSESPQVYWRRRLVVVVVAAVAVIGVIWAIWPKGAPTVSAAPASPISAMPTAVPTPALSAPTAAASPTGSSTPTGPQACLPANLRLGLAGFQKLTQGSAQPFKASITNNSSTACVLTVNPASLAVTVTSGKDRIWSTTDCAAWVPTKKITLAAQQAYVFEPTWSGTRSKATCKTTKDAVGPGTYVAKVTFTGAAEARLVMLIVAA